MPYTNMIFYVYVEKEKQIFFPDLISYLLVYVVALLIDNHNFVEHAMRKVFGHHRKWIM